MMKRRHYAFAYRNKENNPKVIPERLMLNSKSTDDLIRLDETTKLNSNNNGKAEAFYFYVYLPYNVKAKNIINNYTDEINSLETIEKQFNCIIFPSLSTVKGEKMCLLETIILNPSVDRFEKCKTVIKKEALNLFKLNSIEVDRLNFQTINEHIFLNELFINKYLNGGLWKFRKEIFQELSSMKLRTKMKVSNEMKDLRLTKPISRKEHRKSMEQKSSLKQAQKNQQVRTKLSAVNKNFDNFHSTEKDIRNMTECCCMRSYKYALARENRFLLSKSCLEQLCGKISQLEPSEQKNVMKFYGINCKTLTVYPVVTKEDMFDEMNNILSEVIYDGIINAIQEIFREEQRKRNRQEMRKAASDLLDEVIRDAILDALKDLFREEKKKRIREEMKKEANKLLYKIMSDEIRRLAKEALDEAKKMRKIFNQEFTRLFDEMLDELIRKLANEALLEEKEEQRKRMTPKASMSIRYSQVNRRSTHDMTTLMTTFTAEQFTAQDELLLNESENDDMIAVKPIIQIDGPSNGSTERHHEIKIRFKEDQKDGSLYLRDEYDRDLSFSRNTSDYNPRESRADTLNTKLATEYFSQMDDKPSPELQKDATNEESKIASLEDKQTDIQKPPNQSKEDTTK